MDPKHPLFLAVWEKCRPWLAAALLPTHEIGDVLEAIQEGRAQFWPDADAAVVTELVAYPRRKHCRCWLAGGSYEGIRRIEERVIPWAKAEGCEVIEIIGRLGWRRRLGDYREQAAVLVKEI